MRNPRISFLQGSYSVW